MNNSQDIRSYESATEFFLIEDALRNIEFDISFSLAKKYYCDAGCKVCYIEDLLKDLKPTFGEYTPDSITEIDQELWEQIFEHFFAVRTYDDFMYLKLNYPIMYNWYIDNAEKFEFGFTDNSLFRNKDILMNNNFKGISEITLSSRFIEATHESGSTVDVINLFLTKYSIMNLKIIYESEKDSELISVNKLISIFENKVDNLLLHSSFKVENFDIDSDIVQNTCILHANEKVYIIQKESLTLHNNSFYFSADDAADKNKEPFYIIENHTFDTKNFLSIMLEEKIKLYANNASEIVGDSSSEKYFKNYFNSVSNIKVNSNYNFIPSVMLRMDSTYAYKLKQMGFKETEVGLYLPSGPVVPIIDYK